MYAFHVPPWDVTIIILIYLFELINLFLYCIQVASFNIWEYQYL